MPRLFNLHNYLCTSLRAFRASKNNTPEWLFPYCKQFVEHHMGAPRQDMQSDAQVYSVSFSK